LNILGENEENKKDNEEEKARVFNIFTFVVVVMRKVDFFE
jgi:hypothetical protein